MAFSYAFDVGTNSIGWWIYEVQKAADGRWQTVRSVDGGVRIIPDGREPSSRGRVGDSRAVNRRMARGARRNREHSQLRMEQLLSTLVALGLLPADEMEREALFKTPRKQGNVTDPFNPYRLRARAATEPVSPSELGRALFHLGRRRGYLSNRKEASDEDGGKLKARMEALHEQLAGQTLGAYLWRSLQSEAMKPPHGELLEKPQPIRFADGNPFFASRALYRSEFETIRAVQAPHHKLTEGDWQTLATYILDQRPLKPVERGRCELFTDELRHWKDTPIGHAFRIFQELNNLRLIDRDLQTHSLSKEQYDAILHALMHQKALSFGGMRKLKDAAGNRLFPADSRFNLESKKRKELKGHRIAVDMAKDPVLAGVWQRHHADGTLDAMFEILFEADSDAEATQSLTEQYNLTPTEAAALARMPLARATGSLSCKAMQQLVAIMRDQGLQYHDAVQEMYDEDGNRLHHSHRSQEVFDRLPYYGAVMPENMLGADYDISPVENPEKHFGRINNPTVHIVLNQMRKLVNTLVDRFGEPPVKIHVEMARELKKPKKQREEMEREQARNEKRNTAIRKRLQEEHGIPNPSAGDVKKWKLWEELGRGGLECQCPFTGQSIAAHQLFNGEVEIEHILPFSRTLDNGMSNLTLAMRWANRLKGNRTPWEAFSANTHAADGIVWQDIVARAKKLPVGKAWRFGENAMDRFEKDNDFIARQLTDTAYMARVTARYLKALEGVEEVITLPGSLTAMVRGKWRLNGILGDDNRKSRDDHRHHAVDAAVIGLIDRSLLQDIGRMSKRGTDDILHLRIPELDHAIEADIRSRIPRILTCFRPNHGLNGKMFKDTAYGFTGESGVLVTRKPLASLTAKEVTHIRDHDIRDAVGRTIAANPGKKLEILLKEFGDAHGIKRVRITVPDQTVKPVPSAPYKGYKPDSYVCCDIWAIPPRRKGSPVTYAGAFWGYHEVELGENGQPGLDKNSKKPHPAARYITRVFKDDMIETGPTGNGTIHRVAGFSTTNNTLDVRDPNSSDSKQVFKSINKLAAEGLRRLHVTPDGRVLRRGSGV